MERSRLIVNFDSSGDKLLSTENVVACGETFDILFRDVTLSGTVRVAFWDYETLLWRSEGSASQGDGGSVLEGLVADTKELADVFRGGSGFFAARLTVGEQVGGDEWRDYGIAYVRLYRGTNPSENPEPARPDVYPTEEELAKWLEEAGVIAGNVTTGATRAEQAAQNASTAAEIAQSSSQTAQRMAQEATSAKNAASESASRAYQSANSAGQFSSRASDYANKAKRSASDAENYAMQAQGAKGDASRFAQRAAGARTAAEAAQKAAETAAGNAQTSAQEAGAKADAAKQSAAAAQRYASDASGASISAAESYENAEASRKAAESAAQVAQDARDNAQLQQQQASAAAGKANGYRQQAQNAQRLAERAQEKAEAAQQAAEEAQSAADGFASDAAQSAQEAAAKANEANQAAETAASASTSAEAAKTAAETAKTQAEAAKTAANAAKTSAETAKQDAEAAKTAAETAAGNAATSATQAAASATAAQEAKAEVQASAEAVGKNLFRNSILTVDGMDGASYFLRNDVNIAGDGRHYILCRQDKDKNTTRVQVFGLANPIFGNAPLYDFTAKTLLRTDVGNYCPGAAIHEGALYFWEDWSQTKKIDLATGELLANANSGHLVQGPGFINRKNGHVFRHPTLTQLDRFDADLVALDPLPIPEGEGSNVYNKVKVVYIHDVTYAQFSTGRLFWLDAEDVWHLVTDADGDEVRSGTYDGANVAKTLAVWSPYWPGDVEDATGAKKRKVQVSNLKQKWITTGYGADGEAIWAKNGTQNINDIRGFWCVHGANRGPCALTPGFPSYLGDYNGGNTSLHIFNNAEATHAGNGDMNGIVPPIITGGNAETCTSICYRQPGNWRFIP